MDWKKENVMSYQMIRVNTLKFVYTRFNGGQT